MKYATEITIDLPLTRVVEVFDSFENLTKWQPGLQAFEHLDGEAGQAGARTRLVYDEDGRTVEMVETIIERDLPDTFTATYEAKGVHNLVDNHFAEEGPERTCWRMENEFKFSGLMALMGLFMGGAIRKQTLRDMNRFKAFAESA